MYESQRCLLSTKLIVCLLGSYPYRHFSIMSRVVDICCEQRSLPLIFCPPPCLTVSDLVLFGMVNIFKYVQANIFRKWFPYLARWPFFLPHACCNKTYVPDFHFHPFSARLHAACRLVSASCCHLSCCLASCSKTRWHAVVFFLVATAPAVAETLPLTPLVSPCSFLLVSFWVVIYFGILNMSIYFWVFTV